MVPTGGRVLALLRNWAFQQTGDQLDLAVFDRYGMSFKKSLRAPDRPDTAARDQWADRQVEFEPERLDFLDESES